MILRDKEVDDCAIYFILEGHFNIIITKNHQYMALKQTFFGELSFFTELPRSATVISEGVSRLLKLKRSEFLKFVDYHDKVRPTITKLSNGFFRHRWTFYTTEDSQASVSPAAKGTIIFSAALYFSTTPTGSV